MKSSLPPLSLTRSIVAMMAALAALDAAGAETQNGATANSASPYAVEREVEADDHTSSLPPGDRLVVQAMNLSERRPSIIARLAHQVHVDGRHLAGAGGYWQQGSGENLRVRMELELKEHNARLLQVSDGRFLWIDERLPTGRTVTRVNLQQLRADAASSVQARADIQPGEASWSPLEPELSAYSGGLPGLLVSLSKNFSFLPPQAMRLDFAGSAAGAAKIPVFAVVGHWRPERLAAIVKPIENAPPQQNAADGAPQNRLPARIPQEVLLLVGQADLFPYRVEFRRLETPVAITPGGAVISYQISASPIAVLSFSDVSFDTPIANGQFDYNAGEADWTDRTAERLEALRR